MMRREEPAHSSSLIIGCRAGSSRKSSLRKSLHHSIIKFSIYTLPPDSPLTSVADELESCRIRMNGMCPCVGITGLMDPSF